MNNKKTQPFTISRSNSSKSSFSFLDRSLSASFDDCNGPVLKKQNSFLSRQNSLILSQPSYKNCYTIFKTDITAMPELLEQYSQANLYYRDEEFTQQSEVFITKVAQDKRIPKEFRAKFPLYQILVSICKIFMLNEYEIVAFSCTLDHCNWKIEEVVDTDEAHFLEEFPANFGVEINEECKRFIMYLLIITFSLKQYLNDKSEVDPIQAYCEKICNNFQVLFNRWTKLSALQKFNYSAPEINRKFRYLSKREYSDRNATPKDYNMIADHIMTLTGSYASSKNKAERQAGLAQPEPQPPKNQSNLNTKSPQTKNEIVSQSFEVPKPFIPDSGPFIRGLDRGFVRTMTMESLDELLVKIPNSRGPLQRQESISQLLTNFATLTRQESFDFGDKDAKKKVKWENGKKDEVENIKKENVIIKAAEIPGLSVNMGNQSEAEDDLPRAANAQQEDEIPSLSRLNSTLSLLYEK